MLGCDNANIFDSSGIFCAAGLRSEFAYADYAGDYDAHSDLFIGQDKTCKSCYKYILFILKHINVCIFNGRNKSGIDKAWLRNRCIYSCRRILRGRRLIYHSFILLALLYHRYERLRKNGGYQYGYCGGRILSRVPCLFHSFIEILLYENNGVLFCNCNSMLHRDEYRMRVNAGKKLGSKAGGPCKKRRCRRVQKQAYLRITDTEFCARIIGGHI